MANKAPQAATMGRSRRQSAMRASSSGGNAKRGRNGNKRPSSGKASSRARKKKKGGMSVLGKIAIVLCILLLLVVFAAIAVVYSKIDKMDFKNLDPDKLSINEGYEYDETGYLNVALFGLDKRENVEEMGTRSDTIIIASLNRETKEVKMSSVYRDTLLQMDDGTYNKANAAYAFGEEEEAVAMLNRNLDMDITHYVTVDFSAMVDMIDAVDGIDVEVTEEEIPYLNNYACEIIENTGVDTWGITEPGYQHLTGVQATAYARIRATEGDDYRRTERQRLVLTKIAEKAQAVSLSSLNMMIDRVLPKVRTNFTLPEILAYAKDVKKYTIGETLGFPFDLDTMYYGEAGDSVVPNNLEDNVKQLHEFLFGEDGYSPSSTVSEISDELVFVTGIGYPSESNYTNHSSGYGSQDYSTSDGAYNNSDGYGSGDGTSGGDYGYGTGDDGTGSYGDGYGTGTDGSGDWSSGDGYGNGDGTTSDDGSDYGTGSYGDGNGYGTSGGDDGTGNQWY
nr:LCP family protein [uncultured Schaedlerella sp.]